jgi:polyisoprenoid-binding protein YceI
MASLQELTPAVLQAQLSEGKLAGAWTLDPARSQVRLKSRHTWGLLPVDGVFREVAGHGTVTAAGDVSGVITVAAASVDTENPRRDKHLRSADFLDAGQHPDITFTAGSVAPAGDRVRISGTLTVAGRTRPAAFDARVAADQGELQLDGELAVNRTDFGLTWNFIGIAATRSTLIVRAVFARQ